MVFKGLLAPEEVSNFYQDLQDESFVSAFALVHSRYSDKYISHLGNVRIQIAISFIMVRLIHCAAILTGCVHVNNNLYQRRLVMTYKKYLPIIDTTWF